MLSLNILFIIQLHPPLSPTTARLARRLQHGHSTLRDIFTYYWQDTSEAVFITQTKQYNKTPRHHLSVPLHQLISALDKMAAISQATFSSTFSWMRTLEFRFNFRIFFSPKSPIDNRSALVQVMARRLFGAKPLPETMLTQFTDVNTGHWVGWVKPSSKRCDMS